MSHCLSTKTLQVLQATHGMGKGLQWLVYPRPLYTWPA